MNVTTALACLPLLLGAPGAPSSGASSQERTRALAEFPRETVAIGAWMKQHKWKSKRNSPKHFTLADGCLHLVSDDDSVLIGTEAGLPLDPHVWSRLRFSLRVDEVPSDTNLAKKSGDDAAFRIYVAFDLGGGLFSPPNTIAYTWTEQLEPEALVQSAHYKRLRYLSIGKGLSAATEGASEKGWVTIERDLPADYRRVFGSTDVLPKIVGIMLKCDSNNTGTRASAWLKDPVLVGGSREDG